MYKYIHFFHWKGFVESSKHFKRVTIKVDKITL